jgi:hypothetical protein
MVLPNGNIHHMRNAKQKLLLTLLAATAIVTAPSVNATCWEAASESYGIPVAVLKAVAKTESGFNSTARNNNKNGTHDIGIMQINSAWLPKLEQYQITEESLGDACTNVKVGAWILSNNAKKLGWNWNAIGAYNVGCAKLDAVECDRRRASYAWKIHTAMNRVGAIDTRVPQKEIPSYQQASNVKSRKAPPVPEVAVVSKKIMVIHLASAETSIAMAPKFEEREVNTSIGGFLNYAEERFVE